MKTHTEELLISTEKRQDIYDITESVVRSVEKSNIKEGLCVVYTKHTTTAISVNENADPNISEDIIKSFSGLVPEGKWLHDKVDGNGDSHIKATMIGASETIPIVDNKLALGAWQRILLLELDGPRERKILVQIIG